MLFNSYSFLLFFLPLVVGGVFVFGLWGRRASLVWLLLASILFYGWWRLEGLLLLGALTVANYGWGKLLQARPMKILLGIGIAGNLAVLCWFKYAGFLALNLGVLLGQSIDLGDIVLPLAISFFTFQKIAFLIDIYTGRTKDTGFIDYALFVWFFPQLIAGPIVHHAEIVPQFRCLDKLSGKNITIGLSYLTFGLVKKVGLADQVAPFATSVFDKAASGQAISFLEGWSGALAYMLQIYFDFSGYSDMAIGLAALFGLWLPVNFASPYKADSIVEFWRRWHMTLSKFLRDYLYIPLGGNRHGRGRAYLNIMIVMVLGGLWHGAGWTFLAWGTLHGLMLAGNHLFWLIFPPDGASLLRRIVSRFLTFLAVLWAWVLFRAPNFDVALNVYQGMLCWEGRRALPNSLEGLLGPFAQRLEMLGWTFVPGSDLALKGLTQAVILLALVLVAVLLPNSQEWVGRLGRPSQMPARSLRDLIWRPNFAWGLVLGMAMTGVLLSLDGPSEFLYFQF